MAETAAIPREDTLAPVQTIRSACVRAIRLTDAARAAGKHGIIHFAQDERTAERVMRLACRLAPDIQAILFPPWDCLPYDGVSPSREIMGQRMSALHALAAKREGPLLVVTTVDAVIQRVPPRSLWQPQASMTLRTGDKLDLPALEAFLRRAGYGFDDRVDEPGEAALRGQVVDIFPAGAELPVRIEYEGGQITEIHPFDPLSQRTADADIEAVPLQPACEIVLGEDPQETRFPGAQHWLPQFYPKLETLFDYLPHAAISGAERLEERRRSVLEQIDEAYEAHRELPPAAREGEVRRAVLRPDALYLDKTAWDDALRKRKVEVTDADALAIAQFTGRRASTAAATAWIRDQTARGTKVVLASADERQLRTITRRIERQLGEAIDPLEHWDELRAAPHGKVFSMLLPTERGFVLPEENIAVIAGTDILGQRARTDRQASTALALEQTELDLGDTVIHLDHGMGLLRGLETIEAGGETCEMVRLEYAEEATLLAPIDEIGMIWRYGSEAEAVSLDRLDGEAWQKRRIKVEAEIAEAARRLVELSHARAKAKAKAFVVKPGDYDRFIARFPYSESPDQATAIEETLHDLASGRPMDRLVCGDVGFGKTEVALRAAAAVAMAGGQVAVVAPTTVLARQHVETFRRRFAGFGIEIGQLSRLAKPAEAREVKKGLAEGRIRIVIGTHAIAGKDVRFKDLGLLIIDEEQRFGARDKAKLRSLGEAVHVLTLTATPIPRTLQAAIVGIQDLSVIATAPVRRRPIRTVLTPFEAPLVRQALLRERSRGGQSFVVCPRVEDMEPMATKLRELVPELRILTAHGKMPAGDIDEMMMQFAGGTGDVLLATNIIESGLDLPGANTMLIWRADRFGLSQLHQLRGRVGRGRRRGVAYLLTDPRTNLATATQKRLRTLETLDRLGAGFEISARDLDLRGAGDLIGEEQAGHIKLIGADLYRQLLDRALERARGGNPKPDRTPDINLGPTAFIPADYVPEPEVRLNLYARLTRLGSLDEVEAFAEEIEDRFGQPPSVIDELLAHARLAILGRALGAEKIEGGPKAITIAFRQDRAPAGKPPAEAQWREGRLFLPRSTETARERYALALGLLHKMMPTG
jgi:transcription-repair coupling factor (superfamily II helicase)